MTMNSKIFAQQNNIFPGINTRVLTPKRRCFTASIHPRAKAHGFLEAFNKCQAGLPRRSLKAEAGQTFIEIVVALGVAVVIVVALVSATIASMRNAQFAKLQAQATKLSQEALEKARAQRDQQGWATFKSSFAGVKCLPSSGVWSSLGCTDTDKIDGVFLRSVTFTNVLEEEKKSITVTTSWTDANGIHQSTLVTYLTKWQ